MNYMFIGNNNLHNYTNYSVDNDHLKNQEIN